MHHPQPHTTHTLTLTPPTHAPSQVYAHVGYLWTTVTWRWGILHGVLCELSSSDIELNMQAIECFLTSVKPTIQSSSYGKWAAEANDRFKQLTMSNYLMNQVKIFKAKS